MSTTVKHFILGTAGHIDHGKSSLIKALTGTDPDRLKEEKKRGITIELGFAQLDLGNGVSMGVVDVPGHERFVRQMIAGASGIDCALLCIAADDGIMPQTREHIAILELLAIPRLVVAITKSDLVDSDWLSFVSDEIRSFLATTPYANAPLIATSSETGEGLDELKAELRSTFSELTLSKETGVFRLPIDRVFTIKGSGTVITGTLWSGSIKPDEEVEILPYESTARVRSVQVHGKTVDEALAGNRVAINLNAVKTSDLKPGDFLVAPGSLRPTDRFDAYVTFVDTAQRGKPLKSGTRVHVAHGTREVIGRILFMNGQDELKQEQACFAQIRLEEPLPVSLQDRFIIRSYSPVHVIGGGTILRAHPKRRTNLNDNETTLLEALHESDNEKALMAAIALQDFPATADELSDFTGIDLGFVEQIIDSKLDTSVETLKTQGQPTYYATKQTISKLLAAIENRLIAFHAQNPHDAGIAKAELRNSIDEHISTECFDVMLDKAAQEGKAQLVDGKVSHPKASAGAQQAEDQAIQKLLRLLSDAGVTPPTLKELFKSAELDSSLAYRALGKLEQEGLVRRITTDICFESSALEQLQEKMSEYLRKTGQATAAELKDAMETSRKYAIPLLEYFDNQGITKREGDKRRLT